MNNPTRKKIVIDDPDIIRAFDEGVLPGVFDDGTVMVCSGMSGGARYVDGDFRTGFPEELTLLIRNPNGTERFARYCFDRRQIVPISCKK